MEKIITVLIVVFLTGLAAVGYAYSGLYDVSASSPHGSLAGWFLSTTSHSSTKRRAGDVDVPALDDEAMVFAGINDFDSMCIGCHGRPGKGPAGVGLGLNPSAPDLAKSAQHMTAAELFWVTKHGIKMTGMPAWGATHEDQYIWPMVAFMTKLPELDEQAYQDMLDAATGHGHHAEVAVVHDTSSAENDGTSSKKSPSQGDGAENVEEVQVEQNAAHDDSTHEHNDH